MESLQKLDISFLDPNLSRFDQHLEKNYHNSWAFRLGAQYGLTERFDIRAGLILDLTPVNKQHYNPETPGMTKIEPSVGLSFRPIKNLSIDLAMLYVIGLGADNAIGTYTDMLAPKSTPCSPPNSTFPLPRHSSPTTKHAPSCPRSASHTHLHYKKKPENLQNSK